MKLTYNNTIEFIEYWSYLFRNFDLKKKKKNETPTPNNIGLVVHWTLRF